MPEWATYVWPLTGPAIAFICFVALSAGCVSAWKLKKRRGKAKKHDSYVGDDFGDFGVSYPQHSGRCALLC
jgi:hypothetical protein